MTEERIEEIWEEIRKLYERYEYGTIHIAFQEGTRLIRTVAAEAWEEGIDEMRDAIAEDFKSDIDRSFYDCDYINSAIKEIAVRLKDQP